MESENGMNLLNNNKESLIGNVNTKKPLRSCLKRAPLIDLTSPLAAKSTPKRKRVSFCLDLTPKRMSEDLYHQLAHVGDVTRGAYYRIAECVANPNKPRVLVSYQSGITRNYIEYLFNRPWHDNKANDNQHIAVDWKNLDSIDEIEDVPCVYVIWRPDHQQCRHIYERFSKLTKAVALVLGDVNLMIKLSKGEHTKGLPPGFERPLTFLVTSYDLHRDGPYSRDPSDHESVLNASGGIPALIELQHKEKYLLEFSWIRHSKIFGRLFIMMLMNQPIEQHWRERKTGLSMLDLARACGFTFIPRNSLNSSVVDATNSSMAGSVLDLCQSLKDYYSSINEKINKLMKPVGVAWQVMENVVVQNLLKVDKSLPIQTFARRFPFLEGSFVADITHELMSYSFLGPKVTTKAKISQNGIFSSDECDKRAMPLQIHPQDWCNLLTATDFPIRAVVQPRESSGSPDAYVLVGDKRTDGGIKRLNGHLLCFQAKYGSQDLALSEVLDELAKCPQVSVVEKSYGNRKLAYDKKFITQTSHYECNLTFVYAAMTHAKVIKKLTEENLCDEINDTFVRCTHVKFSSIPEDVELIILRPKGLVMLLGSDMYSYLKSFKPATISSSLFDVYDNPVVHFLRCKDSDDPELVKEEISQISKQYSHFKIDTSGIKLVRRPNATSSGANSDLGLSDGEHVSPILSEADGSPNKAIEEVNSKGEGKAISPPSPVPVKPKVKGPPKPVPAKNASAQSAPVKKIPVQSAAVKKVPVASANKYANVQSKYSNLFNT